MDLTTTLTGALPAIILISAVLTAALSVVLLKLYRRAVIRSMGTGGAVEQVASVDASEVPSNPPPLSVNFLNSGVGLGGRAKSAYDQSSNALRCRGLVYGIAGIVYALILSMPWMLTAEGGFPLMRLIWLFICYAWPTVIVVIMVAASSRHDKRWLLIGYISLVVVVGGTVIARNPDSSIGQLLFFWFYVNAAPTLLLTTFLWRRIRAVGPLVLIFMVAGVTGAEVFLSITGNNDGVVRAFAAFGYMLGLDVNTVFLLIVLLGFVALGYWGWRLLGRLGHAYHLKGMSDQSLQIDALWLMFAIFQSITLVFEDWLWIFTGPVAFIIYKLITGYGFGHFMPMNKNDRSPSLLLLRVFALGRRSEALFDHLAKRWLQLGSIDMIAGPDLATSTVEPHEFLDFVGGHLSRSFINNSEDLNSRLALRDTQPDPDGRFRTNEFFCRNDTWQMCMQRLAKESDVVLMDLRSFGPSNQGCLWELGQLLAGISLKRVLFVIDDTTDQDYLKQMFQTLWRQVPVSSPNLSEQAAQVNVLILPASSSMASDQMEKRLFQACYQPM
ncbi:MAG: hypothetical protein ABW101_10765 [Candidatus Thiodiazotropha sp.]